MNNPLALLPKAGVLVAAILALTNPAAAQDYPVRPVRLVVPCPPGGSNDVVGRLIGTHLAERLGKQVVVDNRGGAGAAASGFGLSRSRARTTVLVGSSETSRSTVSTSQSGGR